MGFDTELATATTLATEYTALGSTLGAMACAADRDPTWGPADDEEYSAKHARQREVAKLLGSRFIAMAFEYSNAWKAYLAKTTAQLTAAAAKNDLLDYERDGWTKWSNNRLAPEDQPEMFARGLDVLARYT